MFLSISNISNKLDDSSLSSDVNFLKQLIQDESFQVMTDH